MKKITFRSYGYKAIRLQGNKTLKPYSPISLSPYRHTTLLPYTLITLFVFLITLLPYNPIPRAYGAIPGAEGVTLSPPVTEITINKGEKYNGKIKLTNPLDKQIELYTSAMDFLAEGETGGQKFLPATSENRTFSLASWITISKPVVALTPEEVEEVDYFISVPKDAEPCGHYAVIFFSSQPPELEGEQTQIALASQVGGLILANIPGKEGECVPSGVVETFTAPWLNLKTPVDFLVRIRNLGLVHFKPRGEIKIKNWGGAIIDSFKVNEGNGNVLPDSARRFEEKWLAQDFKWWQKIGRFKAELGLVYGREGEMKSLTDSLVFWIIPWWIFLILGLILTLVIYLLIRRWQKKRRLRQFYVSEKNHTRPILR